MFRKQIKKWKYKRDIQTGVRIIELLRKYWSPTMRKDFIVETVLEMDFTEEELVEFSNLLGRVAHDRERAKNNMP